jgi:hypothetical protein
MSKRRRATLDCCKPGAVVGPTLNALGKYTVLSPYWFHSVQEWVGVGTGLMGQVWAEVDAHVAWVELLAGHAHPREEESAACEGKEDLGMQFTWGSKWTPFRSRSSRWWPRCSQCHHQRSPEASANGNDAAGTPLPRQSFSDAPQSGLKLRVVNLDVSRRLMDAQKPEKEC